MSRSQASGPHKPMRVPPFRSQWSRYHQAYWQAFSQAFSRKSSRTLLLTTALATALAPLTGCDAPVEGDQPWATLSSAATTSVHLALGVPQDEDPSDDYLIVRNVYALSYNQDRHVSNWVSWKLDEEDLGQVKRSGAFRTDPMLPTDFYRVRDRDYTNSGFDRGHVCPSADRTRSFEDNALTYLMTNVQPQLHELNNGPWRDLETYERSLASDRHKRLFITAGGTLHDSTKTIGPGITVPGFVFKIIVVLDAGQGASAVGPNTEVLAVMMPNREGVADRAWMNYLVSVDDIERATGYDYLSNIPEDVQGIIEAHPAAMLPR